VAKERLTAKSARSSVKPSKANKDFHTISVRLPEKLHKLAKQKAKQKGLFQIFRNIRRQPIKIYLPNRQNLQNNRSNITI
jgi:hypothetical protein